MSFSAEACDELIRATDLRSHLLSDALRLIPGAQSVNSVCQSLATLLSCPRHLTDNLYENSFRPSDSDTTNGGRKKAGITKETHPLTIKMICLDETCVSDSVFPTLSLTSKETSPTLSKVDY